MSTGLSQDCWVTIAVTPGEACDRLSIATLKSHYFKDAKAQAAAREDATNLSVGLRSLLDLLTISQLANFFTHFNRLKDINHELWNLENEVRQDGQDRDQWQLLVRRIQKLNMTRSDTKTFINQVFGAAEDFKQYG